MGNKLPSDVAGSGRYGGGGLEGDPGVGHVLGERGGGERESGEDREQDDDVENAHSEMGSMGAGQQKDDEINHGDDAAGDRQGHRGRRARAHRARARADRARVRRRRAAAA